METDELILSELVTVIILSPLNSSFKRVQSSLYVIQKSWIEIAPPESLGKLMSQKSRAGHLDNGYASLKDYLIKNS